jgi:hypothetical protein
MDKAQPARFSQQPLTSAFDDMRSRVSLLLLATSMLCLVGCTYTHVGDGEGTPSPDGRFRLAVGIDGASGHAYVNKTKKNVWIWIQSGNSTNSVSLFQREYALTGSDMMWETRWSSPEAVSVEVYDWGDGVSNYKNENHMTSSNHIALLSFVLDKKVGRFIEKK